MAAVCFEKHFLPRKLKCIIKGANTPDDYKEHYSADLIRNLNENVGENTMILTSREPTIDNGEYIVFELFWLCFIMFRDKTIHPQFRWSCYSSIRQELSIG